MTSLGNPSLSETTRRAALKLTRITPHRWIRCSRRSSVTSASLSILVLTALCLLHPRESLAQDANHPSVPIFIELFTSEGCSSCPPADTWLRKVDSTQTLPGLTPIVLSEHVDYWNHDGWKDVYSSSQFTDRQHIYAHNFRLDSPYTPQLIVNGASELHLGNQSEIDRVFRSSALAAMIPVKIGPVTVTQDASSGTLHAHVEINGEPGSRGAEVYLAVALDHAVSHVLHGENEGRQLSQVAVVTLLQKAGKLEKGRSFAQDLTAKLPSALDPHNLRFIVFVQEPGQGKILGAGMRKLTP